MAERKRIGIFGWGVVAPKSPDIDTFERNLEQADSGSRHSAASDRRTSSSATPNSTSKPITPGSTSASLPRSSRSSTTRWDRWCSSPSARSSSRSAQNPGIEQYLQSLGTKAHVYVGTGLGELTIIHEQSLVYDRAQRRWNEFWAAPERCAPLRAHLDGERGSGRAARSGRAHASDREEWIDAKHAWEAYWAEQSDALQRVPRRSGARSSPSRCRRRPASAKRQADDDPPEAEPHPRAEQEVGLPRRAVGGRLAEPALEHRQHPGGADLDDRQDRRPGVRAGRGVRVVRRRLEAGRPTPSSSARRRRSSSA